MEPRHPPLGRVKAVSLSEVRSISTLLFYCYGKHSQECTESHGCGMFQMMAPSVPQKTARGKLRMGLLPLLRLAPRTLNRTMKTTEMSAKKTFSILTTMSHSLRGSTTSSKNKSGRKTPPPWLEHTRAR